MLLHIFAVTINRNALHEVPCTELTFMSKCEWIPVAIAYIGVSLTLTWAVCDALGTCMSSLILVLRTRAVWHRDKRVTAILGILFIGQIVTWSQSLFPSFVDLNDY